MSLELGDHALLDPALQRHRRADRKASRHVGGGECPGQLAQRERVAACFHDQLFADTRIDRPPQRRAQERSCFRVAETFDGKPREVVERFSDRAQREHDGDAFGFDPAGGEGDRLRRRGVEPLGVIDDAHQSIVAGGLGQQTECGESDEEGIRRRADPHA